MVCASSAPDEAQIVCGSFIFKIVAVVLFLFAPGLSKLEIWCGKRIVRYGYPLPVFIILPLGNYIWHLPGDGDRSCCASFVLLCFLFLV